MKPKANIRGLSSVSVRMPRSPSRSLASALFISAALFACERSTPRQARRDAAGSSDIERTDDSIRVNGGMLHFRQAGRGDVIVLLSGGPGYASKFLDPIYTHVAVAHRAILIDQRGTGRSAAFSDSTTFTLANSVDDIEKVRRRLAVEKITLLGHSWGGTLAMAYAATYPTRVTALVLVGSGGLRPAVTNGEMSRRALARLTQADRDSIKALSALVSDPAHRDAALRAIRLLNWKAYEYDPASVRFLAALLTPGSYDERTARLMYADLLKSGPMIASELDGSRPAKATRVMLIFGAVDPIGTVSVAEIHHRFPAASIRVVPRSGHHPWIESPSAFYEAIDRFLEEAVN